MIRRTVLVMLGALALVAFTACSDSGPDIGDALDAADGEFDIETPEGDVQFDVGEDGGEINVEGEDGEGGSFSIGGGEIPDNFPDDIPLPDDYEVTGSSSFEEGGSQQATVSMSTPESHDDLVSLYEDGLDDAGYNITNTSTSTIDGQETTTIGFEGNGLESGIVNIGVDFLGDPDQEGDSRQVSITYASE